MLIRCHTEGHVRSEAVHSDCESYRYSLTRTWSDRGQKLTFIMLNPSKADERKNDPTVERCERRAKHLACGAFRVVNIFAWRETDPAALRRASQPIGPDNGDVLAEAAHWADLIIAAWGVHGAHLGQGPKAEAHLRSDGHTLHHLGLTKDGHPRHPLYVSYQTLPKTWAAPHS
ncbi:MAG: DUF1643 domain-containing protein [Roseobacter sp.]